MCSIAFQGPLVPLKWRNLVSRCTSVVHENLCTILFLGWSMIFMHTCIVHLSHLHCSRFIYGTFYACAVLPKFELTLEGPKQLTQEEDFITGKVVAK